MTRTDFDRLIRECVATPLDGAVAARLTDHALRTAWALVRPLMLSPETRRTMFAAAGARGLAKDDDE